MNGLGVSEIILKKIREVTDSDHISKDFLIELINEEIENPTHWKNIYKSILEKCIKKTENDCEN